MYVPCVQFPHVAWETAPLAVEKVPEGHRVGVDVPSKQYPPGVQVVHTESPVVAAKVPTAQGIGKVIFRGQ